MPVEVNRSGNNDARAEHPRKRSDADRYGTTVPQFDCEESRLRATGKLTRAGGSSNIVSAGVAAIQIDARRVYSMANMLSRGSNWLGFLLAIAVMATEGVAQDPLRIATYNASLYGTAAGELRSRLADGIDPQAEQIAAVVQTVRPDVLLINEIDYEPDGATARLLAEKFFASPQGDREPIRYPHIYAVPSNTGIDSGYDLDRDGLRGQRGDAWGYGVYPGQYSMAVFSRYPIDRKSVRTFRHFLWKDLPGAKRPIHPHSQLPYYDPSVWDVMRLSSKNHLDLPIDVGNRVLRLLASHPTPPVFDGAEDHNGCRNHDEIRFWIDYLDGPESTHLIDDQGRRGGLPGDAWFVIAGDLNSDPHRGDSHQAAIRRLLAHHRLMDPKPTSAAHGGTDTASFGGDRMRVDYVLPSAKMRLLGCGVFWPGEGQQGDQLLSASDHRLVWVEVRLP